MRVRWGHLHAFFTINLLIWNSSYCADTILFESMSDKSFCNKSAEQIIWISEKTSAIIIGKNNDQLRNCQLRFGLASADKNARIQLKFEFLYIEDCHIKLQINESSTTDFKNSPDNREMLMTKCNARTPGPLFAQPKNFVLVSISKLNINMKTDAANFYLNVSMTGVPPTTGLELHVVIIVSFVALILVILAGFVLYKYISRLLERIHERRVQATMTRAIDIFNSQEPLEEPDMVLLRPGECRLLNTNPRAASIAFVHSDGRIERFRPLQNEHCEQVETRVTLPSPSHKQLHKSRATARQTVENHYVDCLGVSGSASRQKTVQDCDPSSQPLVCYGSNDRVQLNDIGDAISLGGLDVPPSYEEALGMPGPSALLLANGESSGMLAEPNSDGAGFTERSPRDYMNVDPSLSHPETNEQEDSDSGHALLPL